MTKIAIMCSGTEEHANQNQRRETVRCGVPTRAVVDALAGDAGISVLAARSITVGGVRFWGLAGIIRFP